MFVTPSRANDLRSEDGAILPLFGLLIVVLLVFAAFTVDLGAAWAERRQLQSAADAGAMASVLPPLAIGDNIASTAMDFVDANLATRKPAPVRTRSSGS